jgi:hypothetical protein
LTPAALPCEREGVRRLTGLLACLLLVAPAAAQIVTPPEFLGPIAGPGAVVDPPGVRFYGTDLGWTFEHKGTHWMLFGDTWPHAHSPCDPLPERDDAIVSLPLAPPDDMPPALPRLTVVTDPAAPNEFARIRLLRDGAPQIMGYNKTPLTAWSDGTDAVGLFGLIDLVRCRTRRGKPSCRPYDHLTCSQAVGICTPATLGYDAPCDLATNAGCILGQQCTPTPTGLCVDPNSSQYDGTTASLPATAAYHAHFGYQDATQPADWFDAGTFASNKFINVTARTVRCFGGRACGNDWTPGHGAVFVWGRPGWTVQAGGQAHMYLMVHRLPIRRNKRGQVLFRPRYFAGLRANGDPLWTKEERRAKPLAMDGVPNGSPDDPEPFPNHMAMSWLGPPVNEWMMLYGGGALLAPTPLVPPPGSEPGTIRVRFADQPWGPWSPPQTHLDPGSPAAVGAAFGPGGWIFHPACVDQGAATCARSDPTRPPDFVLPGCPEAGKLFDVGVLPNTLARWPRAPAGAGLDVFWVVSPWNPYGVGLLRTNVRPAPDASPTCAGTARRRPSFRWCER